VSAESEGDVAAELGTNCNLGKTMASVCVQHGDVLISLLDDLSIFKLILYCILTILYSNFQGHFKGENLKNQLWACARSTTVAA